MSFCSKCGQEIMDEKSRFCPGCGNELSNQTDKNLSGEPKTKMAPLKPPSIHDEKKEKSKTAIEGEISGKLKGTYFLSIGSAILTFIIRLSGQETFYTMSDLLNNRKVVGLDADYKPFYTIIPVAVAIIIALLMVRDRESDQQKRQTAIIINMVLVVLAILFIWVDIPYAIIS